MEEWLNTAARRKRLNAQDIPVRALEWAKGFIANVSHTEALVDMDADIPEKDQALAYAVACEAFDCVHVPEKVRQRQLRNFVVFLEGAEGVRQLNRDEVGLATDFARFFGHIKQVAERAQQARAVAASDDDE
jgi:hypothetical protein